MAQPLQLEGIERLEREPMILLYSIIVGLIAGWLAGVVMKGGGYGNRSISFWGYWQHRRRMAARHARIWPGRHRRRDHRPFVGAVLLIATPWR